MTNEKIREFRKNLKKLGIPSSQGRPTTTPDEEEIIMNDMSLSKWSLLEDNKYFAVRDSIKELIPGLYSLEFKREQTVFVRKDINTDELLYFEKSTSDKILQEIDKFWNSEEKYDNYNFLQRRGYLLYGPQGSGKSCIIQQVIADVIKRKGIAIQVNDIFLLNEALRILRTVNLKKKIVCIYEDIDAIIDEYGESSLLSILDGEDNTNYLLNLATTNYPEKLDKRITSRPRRFDRIIKVDIPEENIRKEYLVKKLKLSEKEASEISEKTKGFSFATLAELVISVKCLDININEAIDNLKTIMEHKLSSDKFEKKNFGF